MFGGKVQLLLPTESEVVAFLNSTVYFTKYSSLVIFSIVTYIFSIFFRNNIYVIYDRHRID